MNYGRLDRFNRVCCGLLASVLGLTLIAPAFALDEGELIVECNAWQAYYLAQTANGCPLYRPILACTVGPVTTPENCSANHVCAHLEQINCAGQHIGDVGYNKGFSVPCSGRTPGGHIQIKGEGDGTVCDNGCEVTFHHDSISPVCVGDQCSSFGNYVPDGNTCVSGSPPAVSNPDPPCDSLTGICYFPGGPKFCATTQDGLVCVPDPGQPTGSPHGPDCGTGASSAVCAGNPPPTPPNPPIPPNTPPDVTTTAHEGGGGGGGPITTITINVTNNIGGGGGDGGGGDGGGGDGGGGDSGGDGSGQGGLMCPDGSQPVNDQCPAHGTCPDGSAPVNGQCSGTVHHCSDGSDPVDGSCPGDGNCDNGQPPVDGQCPVTCPNNAMPVNGHCLPTYAPCQDGSQPVNGQCPASHCNPDTDPNHCQNGQAIGGEGCGAPPSCNGDPIGCATLYQTWSVKCALNGTTAPPPPTLHQASEVMVSETVDGSGLDTSGFLPSSCPSWGTIEVLGTQWDLGANYCTLFQALGALVMVMAAYVSVRILAGGRR